MDSEWTYGGYYQLFAEKLYAHVSSAWNVNEEIYVGESLNNGTVVYIYEIDNANRELKPAASTTMEYGYLKLELDADKNYVLIAGEELEQTTWSETDPNPIAARMTKTTITKTTQISTM